MLETQWQFYSDNIGNANNLNYAFHQVQQGNEKRWTPSNLLFSGVLNNNVAIFPVLIDAASSGKVSFQGVTTTIYPNPTSNLLNIAIEGQQGTYSIKLVSSNGQLVESKSIRLNKNNKQLFDVDVSHLSNGQYLVLIEGENGSRMARPVVITR